MPLPNVKPVPAQPQSQQGPLPAVFLGQAPPVQGIIKIADVSLSSGASVLLPQLGTIPAGYFSFRIKFKVRSALAANNDVLSFRWNTDAAADYNNQISDVIGAAADTNILSNAQTSAFACFVPAANAVASLFATGWLEMEGYGDTASRKSYTAMAWRNDPGAAGGMRIGAGDWNTSTQAVQTVTALLSTGPFAAGSRIVLELYP